MAAASASHDTHDALVFNNGRKMKQPREGPLRYAALCQNV